MKIFTLNITYRDGINIFETYPRKNAVAAWKGYLYARRQKAHVVVSHRITGADAVVRSGKVYDHAVVRSGKVYDHATYYGKAVVSD